MMVQHVGTRCGESRSLPRAVLQCRRQRQRGMRVFLRVRERVVENSAARCARYTFCHMLVTRYYAIMPARYCRYAATPYAPHYCAHYVMRGDDERREIRYARDRY